MSSGGSAMVRGGAISSNKGAPADENLFTEQRNSLNYPRNYDDAFKNKEEVEEDLLDTLDWT